MVTKTNIILGAGLVCSLLFSTQIKQAYSNFINEMKGIYPNDGVQNTQKLEDNIKPVNQTKLINEERNKTIVDTNYLTLSKIKYCVNLGTGYENSKYEFNKFNTATTKKFEEYKDIAEEVAMLKDDLNDYSIDIDNLEDRLDNYRQPVRDALVNEYNRYVDGLNSAITIYEEIHSDLEDTIYDLNQSAQEYELLKQKATILASKTNEIGSKITKECLAGKNIYNEDFNKYCSNLDNEFCNEIK